MPIATSCTNRGIVGSHVLCWVHPEAISQVPMGQVSQSRVVSLQLAVWRQTCQRLSQTITPGGGVGGAGTPIVVSHCVGTQLVLRIPSQ
jgi:hypothetical protein